MISKYHYKKGNIILAMKQIYSIFRVTSTTKNEDTGNESSMVGVLVAMVFVILFLVVAGTGMCIYCRKRRAFQGNIS